MPQPSILPEHHLREGAVDVHSDDAPHPLLLSNRKTGAAGDATPTDPRSRRNRAGRRGGQLLTRALASSNTSACPHSRAPGAPVPDGLTIRHASRLHSRFKGAAPVIPVTNAVESLNRVIRNAIETRGSFPSEEAIEKLIYLAIRGHEKTSRNVRGWLTAVNQFAIMFEVRSSPMRG